jgi:AcrR family transcriptional regulator
MTDDGLTKGERTRQAVMDAAYRLFLEKGFSATSMRQIAEHAGLALGGIYNHFASKDEIFQELIIDRHPYLQIFPVLQRAPGNTTEEFMRNAARMVQEELGRHPEFIKLMFIEVVEFNGRHFPKLFETIFPMALPLLQRFASPESGVRQIPIPQLVRAFMGFIMAFYLTEFLMSEPSLPSVLREMTLEDFMEIFMYGILEPHNPEHL